MKAAALLLVVAAGCNPSRTEVYLHIIPQGLKIPEEVDAIHFTVRDKISTSEVETIYDSPRLALCLPMQTTPCYGPEITARLVPGPLRPNDTVLVVVEALRNNRVVISDAATFTFPPQSRSRLDFILRQICLETDCSRLEQACNIEGRCAALGLTGKPPPDAGSGADLLDAGNLPDVGADMPGTLALGDACNPSSGPACASGNCVDGVCCESACTASCMACNSTGMCTRVTSGQPRGTRAACAGSGPCAGSCTGASDDCTYPSAPCDDTLFCNGVDTCAGGACSVHSGDPCAAGPLCANLCDETNDHCNRPFGTPCAPDGNLCTDDVCNGAGSCSVNNTAPCDDGAFCNGTETCNGGSCTSAGNPCPGGCDETNNACIHLVGIVSGLFHSCGLTTEGVAYCWGSDTSGQLGNGGTSMSTQSPSAVDVTPIVSTGDGVFVQLTAGALHTCGLTSRGGAWCWGYDNYGQLGNGGPAPGPDGQSPSLVDTSPIAGNTAFVQLTAGFHHTCGLTADGVAYCWGWDSHGQLGDAGGPADTQSPAAVDTTQIPGSKTFVQLAAGTGHTCGLASDGVTYCWGYALYGQLGDNGPSPAPDTDSPSAAVDTTQIPGNKVFVQLAAGGGHTCGLTAEGVAHCWGYDLDGQLGNGGGAADTQRPTAAVDTSAIAGNRTFVQLSAGQTNTCGVTADHVAYCWGADVGGQLGNGGGPASAQSPSAVQTSAISGNKTFVQLDVLADHTCGLTADHVAYCWGSDSNGQLGNGGTSVNTQSPSAVDTASIPGKKGFVQLIAGSIHTCGLTAAGVAYCWGLDDFGQLGNGGAALETQSPAAVDTAPIAGNRAFVQLTAGDQHTCGLTADGLAYCWGDDGFGQLGNGAAAGDSQSPSAVDTSPLPSPNAFVQLTAGQSHTCGLTVGGIAYCWGSDGAGQLGNGAAAGDSQSPSAVDTTPIPSPNAFVQLTAGQSHTCGLTAAGVAWCWGFDGTGQLGDGGPLANTQSPSAVDTTAIPSPNAFVQLAAGQAHTCGLTAAGVAYCWGLDSSGRLGNGGGGGSTQIPSAVDTTLIPSPKAFVRLAAGSSHTCGHTAAGVAYCWGSDSGGRLGNGGTSVDAQSPSAVEPSPIPGNRAFLQLTAGGAHTCGLTADGVGYCWGGDVGGQLGNGGASMSSQSPSAIDISGL